MGVNTDQTWEIKQFCIANLCADFLTEVPFEFQELQGTNVAQDMAAEQKCFWELVLSWEVLKLKQKKKEPRDTTQYKIVIIYIFQKKKKKKS